MKTYQADASEIQQVPVEVGSLSCLFHYFHDFFCIPGAWPWDETEPYQRRVLFFT